MITKVNVQAPVHHNVNRNVTLWSLCLEEKLNTLLSHYTLAKSQNKYLKYLIYMI